MPSTAAASTRRRAETLEELLRRASSGELRAVSRLISVVDSDAPPMRRAATALASLLRATPRRSHVVGLTGPPGVGKSTTTSALVRTLRDQGQRVGVLAVDPSSPFSGGALLGDRIRMQEHAVDDGVFIRSMATRGYLGGLSMAVPQALRVLDAAGFDVVLVETVGVGQAEFQIAGLADTTLLVLAPGFGDGVQAVKAGILEVADIFVVNKADRDGANEVVRGLRQLQSSGVPRASGAWRPRILTSVATQTVGIEAVAAAVEDHRGWLTDSGELELRRSRRTAVEIEAIAIDLLLTRFAQAHGPLVLAAAAARVDSGHTDAHAVARELIASLSLDR